jgi:glycosidase
LYPNPNVLVTVLGNHDMQRFMQERGATVAGLNLANTFIMTMRGTPQVYYGDEIGMKGGGDPDNRRDFPGGFPGDPKDAFTKEGRTAEEQRVFERFRLLGKLRKELEPLRRGRLVSLYVTDHQYVYARATQRQAVVVAFNNAGQESQLDINIAPLEVESGISFMDRLGVIPDVRVETGKLKLRLPARSAVILARK